MDASKILLTFNSETVFESQREGRFASPEPRFYLLTASGHVLSVGLYKGS